MNRDLKILIESANLVMPDLHWEYWKMNNLKEEMVDTENETVLNLYKSVGFEVIEKENRYFIEL
ncbi:hypothetical protein [Psychrobacillus lasiicapitis]|uniref:hypothetical protein n=1 Tax=Psychrobacillus lasiicapitis TaxID=1636719 RepID=UPI0019BE29C7|nr:hypothetical protein [Psychrobacillus lasiicapitis]GGA47432.1 hypothetical protein GCM10011384_41390 [Psychrobacillus lasiicapitis]